MLTLFVNLIACSHYSAPGTYSNDAGYVSLILRTHVEDRLLNGINEDESQNLLLSCPRFSRSATLCLNVSKFALLRGKWEGLNDSKLGELSTDIAHSHGVCNLAGLIMFCIFYGFFSPAVVSLPSTMMAELVPKMRLIGT